MVSPYFYCCIIDAHRLFGKVLCVSNHISEGMCE